METKNLGFDLMIYETKMGKQQKIFFIRNKSFYSKIKIEAI